MDIKTENERIQQRNREASARAYKNMRAALGGETEVDGINAVLKFFNEKERVSTELSLSEQLKYIEEKLFIKTRYAELDADWYKTAALPMLIKTTDGEWKTVIPDTEGKCAYIENGRKIRVTAKNAGQFTMGAICFYKGMKNGKITMRDLLAFMINGTSVKDRIMVLIVSALAVLAGMLLPWANSFIFSHIIPAGDLSGTLPAAALILSAVCAGAVLKLLQSLILTNSMLKTSAYIQSGIFARLLSLKTEFFKDVKSGELSKMIMEFSDISQIVSVRSIGACIGMMLSLLYLVQIHFYAPELFGYVLLITLAYLAAVTAESVLSARHQMRRSKTLSKMSGFCYELFSGIEQVKLNGAEMRMMKRFSEHYLDVSKSEDKPFFLKYAGVFYKIITVLASAVIFLFGAKLSASEYIAFSAAYGAYIAAFMSAGEIIKTVSSFRASYSTAKPMLDAECEESDGKKEIDAINGEITISDLSFRYNKNEPYVLNDLSAHINAGESIGLIGTSGCGKSTLLRLLLGFEEPDEGSIYIDGFDLRELNLKSYRRKIGTVLQNTGLISGDIYSNITITKPDATLDEVNEAVEMAGLAEDISALPMGLHTPISQENCTLSGGQRQRILIARALLPKPSILIFDEATSALDNITQAKITESVNKLKCTKIIVAHRLSTIESCDRILVMYKGQISQEGTFEELLNRDGLLKQFSKKQIIR